ncbi:MAG: tail fiber domain-containing protein, partial [Bacteroidota bacterium]
MKKAIKKSICVTAMIAWALCTQTAHAQWWSLTGNAGTTPGTNFLGTTDQKALYLKTKNLTRLAISASGNVGIGTTAPGYKLDVAGDASLNGVKVGRGKGNLNSNTAVGASTLANNTTGYENTVIGNGALLSNTTGVNNSAIGFQSLNANTSGSYNTANGYQALFLNTMGNSNDANGHQSLYYNTTGYENTATGNGALFSNTLGFNNTATGFQALYSNVGAYTVEFGWSGVRNTAYGYQALFNGTNGSDNVAIGFKANYTGNGAQNTNVGAYSEPINAFPIFNATSIGYNAKVNNNNKIRLGDANVTVIEGQVAFSFPSDARFKYNVKSDIPGLDFITQLKPVSYNFDTKKFEEHLMQNMPDSIKEERMKGRDFTESSKIVHSGFLAQDIEKICKQLGYDFDGLHIPDASNKTDNYSVAYSQFIMPLVKSVQELS